METNYLVNGPITSKEIISFIEKMGERKDSGGHSIFLGQVRNDEVEGKFVMAIEYSAYESMIKDEADKIKKTLFSEFNDVTSIDILHSTGLVEAGSVSLLVFVSAGHRLQAIEACRKAVELIKENMPVWKKEIYDDHSHVWRDNTGKQEG